MGLIEQAAKRLEELKRTGADLQDGLQDAGSDAEAVEAAVIENANARAHTASEHGSPRARA
ncbi:MAG TPA: hypothetical protein VFN70_13360, partial [Burkholderiales bacterium]|nr:hypothetical protein [Burkholderiales bacterium]